MAWHTKQLTTKEICQILAEDFDGDEEDFEEANIVCSQEENSDSDVARDAIDDDTNNAIPEECTDDTASNHVYFINLAECCIFFLLLLFLGSSSSTPYFASKDETT